MSTTAWRKKRPANACRAVVAAVTAVIASGLVCGCPSKAASVGAPAAFDVMTRDGVRDALLLSASAKPGPVVIVLHGALMTPEGTIRSSGFAEAAAAHGFTAVFPRGIGRFWQDGHLPPRGPRAVDDVAYLEQLAHDLVARRIAEPKRIYVAGISNGGLMTFRMLCDHAHLFAGAGTVIASLPESVAATCKP